MISHSDMILLTEQQEISGGDTFKLIELLDRTTYEGTQKEFMSVRIKLCETLDEYQEIEKNLWLNYIHDKDRIRMGFNYNMSDLKKLLKSLV